MIIIGLVFSVVCVSIVLVLVGNVDKISVCCLYGIIFVMYLGLVVVML